MLSIERIFIENVKLPALYSFDEALKRKKILSVGLLRRNKFRMTQD
jgi:hypothetical protein